MLAYVSRREETTAIRKAWGEGGMDKISSWVQTLRWSRIWKKDMECRGSKQTELMIHNRTEKENWSC